MTRENVHLFVFDGVADWEAAYAVARLGNPEFQLRPGRHRVVAAAPRVKPLTTMGGLKVLPDMKLDALDPADSAMLILPGGTAWDERRNEDAVDVARAFLAAGVPVAAICGATAALARGGLLDERLHTSNSPEYLKATGYRGAAHYRDAPAVADGGLITASGAAPVDFAYEILKRLEVYKPDTLIAWRDLFKTGDPACYLALVKSLEAA